jgi:hypothetical protein
MLTDGAVLLSLWLDPAGALRGQALMSVARASMAGVRPADWHEHHVHAAVAADVTTPEGAIARLLAHWHALDRGEIDRARAFLIEALAHQETLQPEPRRALLLSAALFTAIHDHDAAGARRFLTDAPPGFSVTATYRPHLVEGVVRIAEHRDDAAVALAEAERLLPEALEPGFARMDRDLLERLKSTAPNRLLVATEQVGQV